MARVPRAGGRWHQVHFNVDIAKQFFGIEESGETITLQRIDDRGNVIGELHRPLVFSEVNRNVRLEFDFHPITDYPDTGDPILVVVELDLSVFRYLLLLPGDAGYTEMDHLNASLPAIGRGKRRVRTTLDEVELRWTGCPLRAPTGPPRP